MDKRGDFIKSIFFIVFIGLFLHLFGLPSLDKFNAGAITIEYSDIKPGDGIEGPAVTICPYQGNPKSAWRNGTASWAYIYNILAKECNHTKAEDMLECIKSKTFSEGEVISNIFGYDFIVSSLKSITFYHGAHGIKALRVLAVW